MKKKIVVSFMSIIVLVFCWQSLTFAVDTNIVAVVDGTSSAKASYYAFSPGSSAFENRYASDYYSNGGTAWLAMQNSLSGAIKVQEQFKVDNGFGRFTTKVGTGILTSVPREGTPEISDVIFRQNAAGFGGVLSPGTVTSTFSSMDGLIGTSEAEGFGQFKAGGIQRIETGTNEPGTGPTTIEHQEAHWRFDGKFKVQVEIIFPK